MKWPGYIYLFAIIILFGVSCINTLTVKSPDKNNSITLELNDNGTLFYSIQSHGTKAVEKSLMGMNIADSALDFNSDLVYVKTENLVIDETYALPTGKTSVYINKANESKKSIQTLFSANHRSKHSKAVWPFRL